MAGSYRRQRGLALALAAWLAGMGLAAAQAGTAAISGSIKDQQGGALPGVTVTATNAATGLIRSTTTSETGSYQMLALPPGTPLFDTNGRLVAVSVQRRGRGCRALPMDAVKRQLAPKVATP